MSKQRGDFEEFAAVRTPVLLRSARFLCGDAHLAEDLVQDTLAKVYVRWHAPLRKPIENPAAYAQTTLTRTFLSSRRRRSSGERPYADVPDQPIGDNTGTSDNRAVLLAALADLTSVDRAVVVLRYFEDLSVEETAERTGLSNGAVRNRTMRALARLRPLVDDSLISTTEKGITHE